MNRSLIRLFGVLVCIALGGCAAQDADRDKPTTVINGCSYRLVSKTNTYFVGESFRLALHIKNHSNSKQELPPVLNVGYELRIQGPGGNEDRKGSWSVQMPKEDLNLLPGGSRIIELPRNSDDCCLTAGSHEVRYCYFGASSGGAPQWETAPIAVECIAQPLVIPEGTDDRVEMALRKLQDSPSSGISSARPGWSSATYSAPMKELAALGSKAIPALLANLHVCSLELSIVQLLGDLKVKEAVPLLLDRLWMEDNSHDSLIIAKLAEITDHPDGYGFHRRWFDEGTQRTAVKAYRDWWERHQRERPLPATKPTVAPKEP